MKDELFSLVSKLLRQCNVILRPVARARSPLIPRLLLVENLLQIASQYLAEDLVWIEAVGTVRELPLESSVEIPLLCPLGNLR